jgi:hypothetical protein
MPDGGRTRLVDADLFWIVQFAAFGPSSLNSTSTGQCLPQPFTSHFSVHRFAPLSPAGIATM